MSLLRAFWNRAHFEKASFLKTFSLFFVCAQFDGSRPPRRTVSTAPEECTSVSTKDAVLKSASSLLLFFFFRLSLCVSLSLSLSLSLCLVLFVCGIVVFICVCSTARTGC